MIIFEFDASTRLQEIRDVYNKVLEIKNSLAEHRDKYRELSVDVEIDQYSIFTCCDSFERSLLIDCYTFAEQLIKNFIYEVIEFENHNNNHLNLFISNKIPRDRFSPNVKFEEIQKAIRKELFNGFRFLYSKANNEIEIYDELIVARHRYAHKGTYNFNFDNFNDVFLVLEYLYYETKIIICNGFGFHKDMQDEYNEIVDMSKKIIKLQEEYLVGKKDKFKELRKASRKFKKRYGALLEQNSLLLKAKNEIDNISNIDLRSMKNALQVIKIAYNNLM